MNPTESTSLDLLPIIELGLGDDRLQVAIDAKPQTLPLVPGCADVQFARVKQIGHRGRFPRSYEWEKLLSSLPPGEELLWVVRTHPRRQGAFEVFLGHKMNREVVMKAGEVRERRTSFRALLQHFSMRVFPESRLEELETGETSDLLSKTIEMARKQVVVVSGMPSPKAQEEGEHFVRRDDALDMWASLNDVLEPFLHEDKKPFTIVFSLCRARDQEVRDHLNFIIAARDWLAPRITRQRTVSKNEQTGVQVTEGTTTTEGTSQQEKRGLIPGFIQDLLGSNPNTLLKGTRKGFSGWATDAGVGFQHSVAISDSTTTSLSKQQGESVAFNELNAQFELYDQSLRLQSDMLNTGAGTGAFHSGAMIYAEDPALARRIGQSIMATLSGAKTHVRPFQVITYEGPHVDAHITHQGAAHQFFPGLPILSTHLAAQALLMPEADLPGVRLRRNVFYGQAQQGDSGGPLSSNNAVWLGTTAFSESFVKFRAFPPEVSQTEFRVPDEDLMSHLLITGTTGSGKTLRAVEILNRLNPDDFQIVVIESAKQVFRNKLRRKAVETRIFTLGDSREQPLRINPFFFEKDTSLKRHISILSDALADLLPVEALIAPKLREAVQRAYTKKGWNIEASRFDGPGEPEYPSVLDLHHEANEIARKLRYGAEVNANYLGALTGRTGLFIDDLYQDIFAWDGDRTLEELFGEDDVIIEMDALPPSEIQMPAFVLAVLLERLRARQARDGKKRRRLVLVIEEAHNLLNRKHEVVMSEHESGQGGHLLDQLVLVLQEGREMRLGVVVIDQSPASLADAVLKNTNTKIVHRIADSEEAKLVGSCIGLRDEEWRDLHELDDGECIIKGKRPGKAVKLAPFPLREEVKWNIKPNQPPNYAQGAQIAALIAEPDQKTLKAINDLGIYTKADDLISACCGKPDLLRYMVRKALLEYALDKKEATWDKLPLPDSLDEVRDWLAELGGKSRNWSKRRDDFVQLLHGKAISLPDNAGDLWWIGPLKDFKRRLTAHLLGRNNAEIQELFDLLEQWLWLAPESKVAKLSVGERLAACFSRLQQKPNEDVVENVFKDMVVALRSKGEQP